MIYRLLGHFLKAFKKKKKKNKGGKAFFKQVRLIKIYCLSSRTSPFLGFSKGVGFGMPVEEPDAFDILIFFIDS